MYHVESQERPWAAGRWVVPDPKDAGTQPWPFSSGPRKSYREVFRWDGISANQMGSGSLESNGVIEKPEK